MIHKKMVGIIGENGGFEAAWRVRFAAWATLAMIAGLALRLWLVAHVARVAGDTLLYGDIARNLLAHGVYGFTVTGHAPRPTLIRVPGYPLFLAACFRVFGVEHYQPVLYVQVLVDLVTCLLASALAGRLFGRRAAMAALWLAALCPFTANYMATPLTETLSLFCIALVFYGVERWRAAGMGFNRWLWVVGAGAGVCGAAAAGAGAAGGGGGSGDAVDGLGGRWRASGGRGAARCRWWRRRFASCCRWCRGRCGTGGRSMWCSRWRRGLATDPGELVPSGFNRWYRTWGIDFASTEEVYWNYDGDVIAMADMPARAFDSREPVCADGGAGGRSTTRRRG